MLYDTHAHVNFNAYKDDQPEVVRRSLDKGIWMNVVGSQIDTSKRAVEIAEQYEEGVYAIIGLHPVHLYSTYVDEEETTFRTREETFDPAAYKALAASKKVVAIGECGLDYNRLEDYVEAAGVTLDEAKQKQKEVFIQHIELAAELDLPLMVHCRDASASSVNSLRGDSVEPDREGSGQAELTASAYDDLLTILSAHKLENTCAVMHCFLGTWEQARAFMDLGFYISFTGIVTFKNANEVHEVARQVPLDRMMIETDCPYLTPEPHRGKQRNEPAFVEFVARKIAELKDVSFEEIAEQTMKNARDFFRV